MKAINVLLFLFFIITFQSCYFMQTSEGGGETEWTQPRKINTNDIALPDGYKIELISEGLTFPTSITFDESGIPYVVESGYSYGEVFQVPKLLRIEKDGKQTLIASGENNGPWTSVYFHNGYFIVAEGGELEGGKILKIKKDGEITELINNLPSMGDHHTNAAIVKDGYIYFGQGTATNSGVVGKDNLEFGWLKRFPDFHDIPCKDIILNGKNFESENPLKEGEEIETGSFVPLKTKNTPGEKIKGMIPCSGSIMRIPLDGGKPELVAWGFRNPFGLAFLNNDLYATENGYDDRGSRPIFGTGDVLWKIEKDKWYGWPDYSAGHRIHEVEPLIKKLPNEVPKPVAIFGVHSSSNGIDFSMNEGFGYKGEAFVAQFGDQAPKAGKLLAPVGFKVVRVNVNTGVITDFAVNKGKENGPASWLEGGGLERPVSVRFNSSGDALYIVDFGVMTVNDKGLSPQLKSGVIWKITKIK